MNPGTGEENNKNLTFRLKLWENGKKRLKTSNNAQNRIIYGVEKHHK